MRWATLPCPAGARRRCKCAGSTLFAPAGAKALQSGAPDFGVVAGENRELWRFAHQERLAGAPGERKMRSDSRRQRFQNAAGGKPLRVGLPPYARTAAPGGTNRSLSAPCSWGRQASTSSQRHWRPALPAGSARTRSRDPSLENPFLGERQPIPRSPRPQHLRRQAPARGLAAVYSHHRSKRNETKRPSPLLVGLGRVYFEPTALAGGTAALCRVNWPFSCIPR